MGRGGQERSAEELLYGHGKPLYQHALGRYEAVSLLSRNDRQAIFARLEGRSSLAEKEGRSEGLDLLYKALATQMIREKLPISLAGKDDPNFQRSLASNSSEITYLRAEIEQLLRSSCASGEKLSVTWQDAEPLAMLYLRENRFIGELVRKRLREIEDDAGFFDRPVSRPERLALGEVSDKERKFSHSANALLMSVGGMLSRQAETLVREKTGSKTFQLSVPQRSDLRMSIGLELKERLAEGKIDPEGPGLSEQLGGILRLKLSDLIADWYPVSAGDVFGVLGGARPAKRRLLYDALEGE